MKPSLYLETTIPSFLVGNISPVLVTAGHQMATRRWWEEQRHLYQLFISSIVEDEINEGNSVFSRQRKELFANVSRLAVTKATSQLAEELHSFLCLPPSAKPDASHLAVACYYHIDYLLTWNLKHIANAQIRHGLERLHDSRGFFLPTICTPEELLGD